MTKKIFALQKVELLPELNQREVDDLIKFLRLNAGLLADLIEYESCCACDDSVTYQEYVYDSLKLGYGTPEDLIKFLKNNGLDAAGIPEEEDEDEDEEDE